MRPKGKSLRKNFQKFFKNFNFGHFKMSILGFFKKVLKKNPSNFFLVRRMKTLFYKLNVLRSKKTKKSLLKKNEKNSEKMQKMAKIGVFLLKKGGKKTAKKR